MEQVTVQTLPLGERDDEPTLVDHLYLVVTAGKPLPGARWSLVGIDRVEIGRAAEREIKRSGTTMRIGVPDPWMSTVHLRFERERAHWVAVDAGSRNGILVNATKQDRAVVLAHDVIEAGRSFFMLRTSEPMLEAALEPTAQRAGALATLDPDLSRAFAELSRIAASDLPVLIGGPTGTGKERIAAAVHGQSRRKGAFVPVNCAALPAGLVESELFGHKKGAFSGAIVDAPGLVATSSGGTLFLDEIGDLPAAAQAALLRVLEEHEVRAVGATSASPVDLRVVAATHRDLDALVEDDRFRDDLVARLSGFELELPALADRRVDLGLMLSEILPPTAQLAGAAARALFAYSWPRNVRELVRALERASALAGGGELLAQHLPEEISTARFEAPPVRERDARHDELVALLQKHRGNVSQVASELGKVRQQVQRWLKRYGLDPSRFK